MEGNGKPPTAARLTADEGELATGERLRPVALAALTALLLALCALLTYPFLPAVAWGLALAVIAWPLHAWVRRKLTDNRTAAALLSSAVVVLAIGVPVGLAAQQIAREAASAADQVREEKAADALRDKLTAIPGATELVAWADRAGVDLDAEARKAGERLLGGPVAVAQGSLMAALQAGLAVFILFHLLRDRAELLAAVRRMLPLRRAEADRVFESAAGSVYANLYASLVTSAIDGATAGLMFWVLGLPSPVTWGAVAFVLSLLPVAGIIFIWLPVSAYLAMTGNWGGAAAMAGWGIACSILVDTLLYTRLAGDRMQLHPVPALLAYVGGLAVFGASGIVLGPAIVAVAVAVLDVWHHRAADEPLTPSQPAVRAEPELAHAAP
jgi:predicted PurR-regulated permease PerM